MALLNPNVAYLLLVIGFTLAILAMLSPGTGLMEVGALFTLVMAGYIISALPFNGWAGILFLLALGLLWAAIRLRPRRPWKTWATLAASLLLLMTGSAFLFEPVEGHMAVSPLLIVPLSFMVTGLAWWMGRKTMEAIHSRQVFDIDRIAGMTGRTSSDIRGQGSVYVNGENWTATSPTFIPAGQPVRVIRRKGLLLEVEPISQQEHRVSPQ